MNHNSSHRRNGRRFDRDEFDAVTLRQSVSRCRYERSGMSPAEVAVRVFAETGDLPDWDISDDDGDWAA